MQRLFPGIWQESLSTLPLKALEILLMHYSEYEFGYD